MVNFFKVSGKLKGEKIARSLMIADLPGYGYGQTDRKIRNAWQELLTEYFKRPEIQAILFLVDCRRDLEKEDINLLHFLIRNGDLYFILTKADKLSKNEQRDRLKNLTKSLTDLNLNPLKILAVSSMKKLGLEDLRRDILGYSAQDQSLK